MGGIINYNQLASDTGTYHTNLLKYLGILEDTYVIKLVRPFHKNKHTELRKSPKLYFLDLGLRNYIIQNFNSVDKRGDFGSLLENFVLISLNNTAEPQCYINFWRTLAKAEVDFVFNYVNGLLPIEVKSGSFTDVKITKSMASFIDSYKPENFIVATKDYTAKKKVGSTNVSFVPAAFV
jgi:predicted AAA+ superfamily ATPase